MSSSDATPPPASSALPDPTKPPTDAARRDNDSARDESYAHEQEFEQLVAKLQRLDPAGAETLGLNAFHETDEAWSESRITQDRDIQEHFAGRFQILQRLGGGTFGIVYLATDVLLQRQVALKVPRWSGSEHEEICERFVRESRAASALNHPHIVPVYDAAERSGQLYIASQYVEGPSLAEWIDTEEFPPDADLVAVFVAKLADAVQHAHDARILHRDIKPSNILLQSIDTLNECNASRSLSGYVAKLCDFGLAKFLDQSTDATRTGAVLGTVRYMSPEQAMGKSEQIGPASDVYSLGVLLYQLLTFQLPFCGENDAETLRRICENDPLPPRRFDASIHRDLEAICLKCLDKSSTRRYPTAAALQADLERYLRHEPTVARPIRAAERGRRWIRRNPLAFSLFSVVLLSVSAALVGFAIHSRQLNSALTEAEVQRQIAQRNQEQTQQLLYVADMRLAFQARHVSDTQTVRAQLDKHLPPAGDRDRRGLDWHLLDNWMVDQAEMTAGHEGPVYSSALSPDQDQIATVGADGVVRIWQAGSLRPLAELAGHQSEINDVAFSSEGDFLATTGDEGDVLLWDLRKRVLARSLIGHVGAVYGVAFSPDHQWLATGGRDEKVHLWDASGDKIRMFDAGGVVEHLAFSPESRWLAAVVGRELRLWNPADGSAGSRFQESTSPLSKSAFSPCGEYVVGASFDRNLYVWELSSNELVHVFEGAGDWVLDVQFSSDGERIAGSYKDGTVRIWEWKNVLQPIELQPRQAHPLLLHSQAGRAWSCLFLRDDQELLTTGHDGSLRVFRLNRERLRELATMVEGEELLAVSPGGRWAAISKGARLLPLSLDQVSTSESIPARSIDGRISAVAVGSDGSQLCGSETGTVWVGKSTDVEFRRLDGLASKVVALTVSPSGRLAVGIDASGTACRWSLPSGNMEQSWQVDSPTSIALAFSQDERHLAVASDVQLGVVELADRDSPTQSDATQPRTIEIAHSAAQTSAIAFDASGKWLASGHTNNVVRLWDLSDGSLRHELRGHEQKVSALAFSRDGQTLVSGSHDGTIRLWHLPTAQPLGTVFTSSGDIMWVGAAQKQVSAVLLRPDGRLVFWSAP